MELKLKNKVYLTTCEGSKVDVTQIKSLYVDVPLKEIIGYSFSDHLNKYIPIHNREKFEVYHDHYVYEDGNVETKIRWESCGTLEKELNFQLTVDEYYDKICPIRRRK